MNDTDRLAGSKIFSTISISMCIFMNYSQFRTGNCIVLKTTLKGIKHICEAIFLFLIKCLE